VKKKSRKKFFTVRHQWKQKRNWYRCDTINSLE